MWSRKIGLILGLALSCAAVPALAQEDDANDPLEPFNRAVFEFNRGLDTVLLKPLAQAYRFVLPQFLRDGVQNLLNNARTPVILANDLLQGEWSRAGETGMRFAINTMLGAGGIFDVAEASGQAPSFHNEDFGQTLGVWGVPEGPYLVLPVFGPSPPRDTVGLVGDVFMDPFAYYLHNIHKDWVNVARTGVRAIDTRSRNIETLDDIERDSIDFYATIRSLYRQRRDDEIRNGRSGPPAPMPQISLDTAPDQEVERVALR